MYSQDGAREAGAQNSQEPARTRKPAGAGGAGGAGGAALNGPLALQSTIGNAAVVQMLRGSGRLEDRHRHGDGCGHGPAEQAAPVQRSAVHDVLRGAGRPLDSATRTDMETRLEADFSDVRIHNDAAAKASAAEVGARAYTSGSHVVIGDGGNDKHTLAHELTHVIQQRQGQVAGTDTGDGLRVSDPSDRFERAAEANATRVMRAPAVRETAVQREATQASEPYAHDAGRTVQRVVEAKPNRLFPQQGPSCWLFVLEAIAQAYGIDTTYLRLAMGTHPVGKDLADRVTADQAAGRDEGRRKTSMIMMVERLESLLGDLRSLSGDSISEEKLRELGAKIKMGTSWTRILAFDEDRNADLQDIVKNFEMARDRAGILVQHVGGEGDEVAEFLKMGVSRVDFSDDVDDVRASLENQEKFPMFLSVRAVLKPTDEEKEELKTAKDEILRGEYQKTFDWTGREGESLDSTVHAVLLTNYDKSTGHVTYKDPNRGNAEFRFTIKTFIKMAGSKKGTDRLTMRPFSDNGALNSLGA
ncbi:eCIS core domain-containing protein [Streptomyces anulatus]|uniref:eCIS core domain-containing protein n=1 Tax=Streptomyces anulatus TaxID=1892 RepID=UPI0037FD89FD